MSTATVRRSQPKPPKKRPGTKPRRRGRWRPPPWLPAVAFAIGVLLGFGLARASTADLHELRGAVGAAAQVAEIVRDLRRLRTPRR